MSPQALKARKGEETRAQILDAAVQQASEAGFESLTIGTLAERTGLSKSGLFAHFGSRTELQLATFDEAVRRFSAEVVLPALKAPRGLARLDALFARWMGWPERARLRGGCPIHAAAGEYDDRPGPMRDVVVERQRQVARELAKAVQLAIDTGELRPDTDARQVTFEFFGILLVYYQAARLSGDSAAASRASTAYRRLVDSYRADKPSRHAAPHR
jgi:AcrR family transcriptional regulator